MGSGIAFVAARAGFAVDLIEPDASMQARASERIARDAERAGDADVPRRVTLHSALPASVDGAAFAVEAVPENLELKRRILAQLAASAGPQTILATNTSSLSVAAIAENVEAPGRVLGLHFFNPPAAMKLVEIVEWEGAQDEAIERARAFVERIGKTGVLAADTPGFIVNRVARPFYLQALAAYSAGVAEIEDLDRLARGAGFRMGPFELMDLIGLDVNLATSESVYERTEAERLRPSGLQRDLVARGELGRKALHGFYDYSAGVPKHEDETPAPADEMDDVEHIAIAGFGGVAEELHALLSERYANVETIENPDETADAARNATIVIDIGDGASDRADAVLELDEACSPETIIFVDAYATDLEALASRMKHPERLAGYGILSSLAGQRFVEIVDLDETADDTLEMAQELFGSIGKGVVLVENVPGLFLGRTIGSIVNEAIYAIDERVATPEDIDLAMKLGTNYPKGPVEWGREIGGARVRRILDRLAQNEGREYAPHRALWVLDVEEEEEQPDAE